MTTEPLTHNPFAHAFACEVMKKQQQDKNQAWLKSANEQARKACNTDQAV